ncbi:MAG TPA: GspE/PulE family protein [bacterium]|nr:GspE/PulE family protein [bacterium]
MTQDADYTQFYDTASLKLIHSYIDSSEITMKFLYDMIETQSEASFNSMKKMLFSGLTKSRSADSLEKTLKDIIKINKIKNTRELNEILQTDNSIDPHLIKLIIKYNLIEYDELMTAKTESDASRQPIWKVLINYGKVNKYTLIEIMSKEYQFNEIDEFLKDITAQFLIKENFLSVEELKKNFEAACKEEKNIIQILFERGIIKPEVLSKKFESVLKLKLIQPASDSIPQEILKNLPVDILKEFLALPLLIEKGYLFIGMVNPLEIEILKQISKASNLKLKPVIIDYAFFCRAASKLNQSSRQSALRAELTTTGQIQSMSVPEIVRYIVDLGVKNHATDIHIEPVDSCLRIRYRIDGMLHDLINLPDSSAPAIISRIKVMADLDISKTYIPQDGHITTESTEGIVDIRVSTIYTLHGEKIVLRLIDPRQISLGIDQLGLETKESEMLEDLLMKSQGVILVTGPVGSGKTTTLYACLNKLNLVTKNIMTIEDPVEYKLKNINQIQVNLQRDITFYNGLRAILRQDPNVIMVGEIRDSLTADVSIRAAMTGTLVLSTIHANSSLNTISTLRQMGIANYLTASAVTGILAQRLLRKICPHCSKKKTIDGMLAAKLNIDPQLEHYYGVGCRFCYNTGYLGRIGIIEILPVDSVLSEYIVNNESEQKMNDYCKNQKYRTLKEIAMAKIEAGVTTPDEIYRVMNI